MRCGVVWCRCDAPLQVRKAEEQRRETQRKRLEELERKRREEEAARAAAAEAAAAAAATASAAGASAQASAAGGESPASSAAPDAMSRKRSAPGEEGPPSDSAEQSVALQPQDSAPTRLDKSSKPMKLGFGLAKAKLSAVKRPRLAPAFQEEPVKASSPADKAAEVARLKRLIESIPTAEEDVFGYSMDWDAIDKVSCRFDGSCC